MAAAAGLCETPFRKAATTASSDGNSAQRKLAAAEIRNVARSATARRAFSPPISATSAVGGESPGLLDTMESSVRRGTAVSISEMNAVEAQRVADHGHRRGRHGCGGNHRREQEAECRIEHAGCNGDTRSIVD